MSQAANKVGVDNPGARRSSIEKPPILPDIDIDIDIDIDDGDWYQPTALDRLPDEIIQQILEAADPNSFASLVLLNSKWRNASQQGPLYALQLTRCPSYSTSHKKAPDGRQENLPTLRKLFAREVKRNLFDAYLRPNHTIIKLVSNSISSSSCPGGEGMAFNPSPKGYYLLAYNSSRIYIIDLRGSTISVERELKILRRPAATCIKDDGSLLAVLLTEMQVDLYDLTQTPPKRSQSIILDHSPSTIALSPCGSVLAAAYEGGIEVQSLNPGALATDRRSVKCDAVDALAFSFDGTQILGTTVQSAQPNTVILTAPYYDPGSHLSNDNISALWTTSILFPNTSRDCSHAVLIQESSHEEAAWTFTYDRSFETFRAVRIDDLRNGTTYFTGPIPNSPSQAKLTPCTLPVASHYGDLVSAAFQGKEIWLYGVPEDLEAVPDPSNNTLDASSGVFRRVSASSMRSPPKTQEGGEARVPQWQLLCDKFRNTFVGGFKVTELGGVSTLNWVADFGNSSLLKERLVIAAKGAMPPRPITDEEGMDFEDGGRLTLVDFNYSLEDGSVTELTIEVGTKEPEVLEEEHRSLETEVAIVRRRTVAQRQGHRSAVMRAATTTARPTPAQESEEDDEDPLVPRRIGEAPARPRQPSVANEETETDAILQQHDALDAPYSHTGPRSVTTLRRAATAAANHRLLHPATSSGAPIEYRRADGRAEHPHESDADNWVPPPPPYQKEDPGDVPAFLRHSMTPVLASAQPESSNQDSAPVPPIPQAHQHLALEGVQPSQRQSQSSRRRPLVPTRAENARARTPQDATHQLLASYPTTSTPQSSDDPASRTTSRLDAWQEDDIYNVSPPDTPRLQKNGPTNNYKSDTRGSTEITVRRGSGPSPTAASSSSPYTGTQRVIPLAPRIRTTAASFPRTADQSPGFEQNPRSSPSNSTWNPHTGFSSHRNVMHSQTWPILPPDTVAPAMTPAGYPFSAPPTNSFVNDMTAQSYSTHSRPEQTTNASGDGRQASLSRRISTGFHLPRARTRDGDNEMGGQMFDEPSPPRPGTAQTLPDLLYQPQLQYTYTQPHPLGCHPPFNTPTIGHARPAPDQPLIISTPRGVSGAYDAPTRHQSNRHSETPIFAPVPRHPRPSHNSGLVRPPAERLENMYNGNSQAHSSLLAAPSASGSGTNSRISSLNRRPSRAGRSAAKNMADAKKKGWRPGRRKSKKGKKSKKSKEPDSDVMSQSAWTDVTWSTSGGGGGGGGRSRRACNSGTGEGLKGLEKDKKCVVM